MKKTVCDRCGKSMNSPQCIEFYIGDGNAYGINVLINRIDAKGWSRGDFHEKCLRELIQELIKDWEQ